MSHWQTGKLDLKCSLNILKKALCNVMPEWADHIQVDESCNLKAKYHGNNVAQRYQILVQGSNGKVPNLRSDLGLSKNADGTWEIGGDYYIKSVENKLTGEVMRMRSLAIAQMRGYEVIKNENNDNEIITEIRVDADKAKELL